MNDTFGNFISLTVKFITTQFNNEVPEPTLPDKNEKRVLKALEEKVETITKGIEDCTLQSAVDIIYIGRMENQYLNEKRTLGCYQEE